ncbi:MAG: hypothetical protein ABI151_13040 [Chitinophagaceae bacterium]
MQLKRVFARSIFWRSAYFLSVLILNLGIARYFNSSGSASIYFLSTVYALVLMIAGFSLESGMGYFAAKNSQPVHRFLNLSIAWVLAVSLATLLFVHIFSDRIAEGKFSGILLLFSAVCYIAGNLLTACCSALFYARNNFHTPNLVGVGCNLAAVILLLLTGGKFSLENYLYSYFLIFLVQGLIMAVAVNKLLITKWKMEMPERRALIDLLKYSFTAYFANILFMLVYRIDYWFVDRYCTKEELGNYIQVSKLSQMLVLIPSFLATAVFPAVAAGRKEEVFRGLGFLSRISLIVIGSACLGIGVTGNYIFPFFFGKSFDLMTLPFLLLIPGILSLSSLYPLSAYYSGKNMVGVNLRGCLLALTFIVALDFVIVPWLGIAGAALVSSAGYLLFHGYVLYIFKKEYQTSISEFFFIRKSDFLWIKNTALKLMHR